MFGHGHGKMLNYNKAKENRSAKKLPAPEKYGFTALHCFIAFILKDKALEKTWRKVIYSENKRAENGETPITILGNAKPNGSKVRQAEETAQGQGQEGRNSNHE
jgi:hypothetical protein